MGPVHCTELQGSQVTSLDSGLSLSLVQLEFRLRDEDSGGKGSLERQTPFGWNTPSEKGLTPQCEDLRHG